MTGRDEESGSVKPSEQRGGKTPGEAEAREKGEWAAEPGLVPADLGGSDAPRELLGDDPELGSSVLGVTTGSDVPATEEGVDPSGGDNADATTDGGSDVPEGVEPALRDAPTAQAQAGKEPAGE